MSRRQVAHQGSAEVTAAALYKVTLLSDDDTPRELVVLALKACSPG